MWYCGKWPDTSPLVVLVFYVTETWSFGFLSVPNECIFFVFPQIEENSRVLEYLGHGISDSVSSLDSIGKTTDVKAEKWKQGARKTLLNWVTNALPK